MEHKITHGCAEIVYLLENWEGRKPGYVYVRVCSCFFTAFIAVVILYH